MSLRAVAQVAILVGVAEAAFQEEDTPAVEVAVIQAVAAIRAVGEGRAVA